MDVLSRSDGSAQAVRDAAAASEAIDSRMALERELDRLNGALAAHSAATSQHLNWTLLAQAFLLTSYLIVLVGGWSVPLPGKRWLLSIIAGYGALSLVLGYLSQRGSRDRIAPLRQSRRLVEQALERVANRPTVFSRERMLATTIGEFATRLLPLAILAGWGALSLYTLALPLPTDARTAAGARTDSRAATSAVAPASAPAAAPRGRSGSARKGEEVVAQPVAEASNAEGESGLAALFRRAINAAPAEPQEESVKP